MIEGKRWQDEGGGRGGGRWGQGGRVHFIEIVLVVDVLVVGVVVVVVGVMVAGVVVAGQ